MTEVPTPSAGRTSQPTRMTEPAERHPVSQERTLLQVRGLKKHFPQRREGLGPRRWLQAVNGVDLEVQRGETLGLVGESGCGKSTLGRTILQLYRADAGTIHFDGENIASSDRRQLKHFRRRAQMIFQDPYEALNSRHRVLDLIAEPLHIHRIGERPERLQRAAEVLHRVGLDASAAERFPHEFSGGQRQRIGIARAIVLQPEFLVCDEAVSALDVSIQAQILNLLLELRQELNLTMLFISHDLAVVRHMSDRIAVMYLGRIVEILPAARLMQAALHPYTQALIRAIPRPNPQQPIVQVVPGEVPSPITPPAGCHFHPRCPHADVLCQQQTPKLQVIATDGGAGMFHQVACHHWQQWSGTEATGE